MVVCKFFVQGNCRYGNNCWNDHPSGGNAGFSLTAQRQLFGGAPKGTGFQGRGGSGGQQKVTFKDSFGQNQNPYRWIASDNRSQQQPASTSGSSTPGDIVKTLSIEMGTWEQAHMWPFSCVGYEKEAQCIPGFEDVSPEELRKEAYEAQSSGNFQAYVQRFQSLVADASSKKQEMKNPSMTFRQNLILFIEDCKRKAASSSGEVSLFTGQSGQSGRSPLSAAGSAGGFGTTGGFGQEASGAASQVFAQASGNTGLFGQSSSGAFGQGGGATSSQGFGQSPGTGGFGQGATGGFGQGATGGFGQGSGAGGFGQPTAPPFGQSSGSTFAQGTSGANVFGQTASTQPQPGLFGKPATGPQPGLFGKSDPQPGLFGKPAEQSQMSSFGQPQTLFGKPVTGGATGSTNLFGKTDQSATAGTFGSGAPPGQTGMFGGNVAAVAPSGSPIQRQGHVAPAAGASTVSQSGVAADSVYTPADKLSQEELDQFKAPTFTLGKIPTKPPPREACY